MMTFAELADRFENCIPVLLATETVTHWDLLRQLELIDDLRKRDL